MIRYGLVTPNSDVANPDKTFVSLSVFFCCWTFVVVELEARWIVLYAALGVLLLGNAVASGVMGKKQDQAHVWPGLGSG